jgi:hypothetical protein
MRAMDVRSNSSKFFAPYSYPLFFPSTFDPNASNISNVSAISWPSGRIESK